MDPVEKITITSCVGHCASNSKLDNQRVNLLLHIKCTLQSCLKMIFIEFMVTTSIAYQNQIAGAIKPLRGMIWVYPCIGLCLRTVDLL